MFPRKPERTLYETTIPAAGAVRRGKPILSEGERHPASHARSAGLGGRTNRDLRRHRRHKRRTNPPHVHAAAEW